MPARRVVVSFIHDTFVGHFDPVTLFPNKPLQTVRPLSAQAVEALLARCPPGVRDYVEFGDGYLVAHWAPCPAELMEEVHRFAYRLAEQEQCVAAESPFYVVVYPESAQQAQRRAAEALMAERKGIA
jgi:hypothetical protein